MRSFALVINYLVLVNTLVNVCIYLFIDLFIYFGKGKKGRGCCLCDSIMLIEV